MAVRNVGPEDRIVRIVVAVALGALIYFAHLSQTADIIVGIVAAYTFCVSGLVSRCIFYQLAGVDTSVQEAALFVSTDDRAGGLIASTALGRVYSFTRRLTNSPYPGANAGAANPCSVASPRL